ncbi:hypothetical protein N9X44_00725 [Porticoccaceae bacterium]|nr:hypothetical protein [Porticoccaceae bacterium]
MKILLFGEFSGLHRNLKEGLLELGHEAVIASGHDGYKMIKGDINLDKTMSGFFGLVEARVKPFARLPILRNYDVVQIVNPFFPNARYFPKQIFYSILQKLNKKFFVLGAGSDAYFWRHGREKLKYGPFDDFLKYDVKSSTFYMESDKAYAYNKKIVDSSDGVIPIMFEYETSYESCPRRLKTIPLPINTQSIEYQDNTLSSKLVVFHGLSRYGFKGTRHVESAYLSLAKKYPNDLELVIDGQLPLTEYLRLMRRTNVVIDQVYTHSLGMNGVYALAMGKVVIGGAEPESLSSLGIDSSPVLNVTPDKESIIRTVEYLLDNRASIPEMGFNSRNFVEKYHCHIKVAEQYVSTWKSVV